MNQLLDVAYERYEYQFSTLLESIAANNPSPQAALDLIAADDELSQALAQLLQHQENHKRIQALRSTVEALEEKQKSAVEKLAGLRHELFETPTTTFPQTLRLVTAEELLQNASYISKHTVPPTYRERVPDAGDQKDKDKDDTGSSAAPTNGLNTPTRVEDPAETTKDPAEAQKEGEAAVTEITAEEEEWLRKLRESQFPWYPWPSNERIRASNLQKLMYHREKGDNLDDFDVKTHYENMRKNEPEKEPTPEAKPDDAPVEARQYVARRPQPQKKDLSIFDDVDE